MAIKHVLPPTESALAQTARPLRLPLKGGVKFKGVHETQNRLSGLSNDPIRPAPDYERAMRFQPYYNFSKMITRRSSVQRQAKPKRS